jgi:hypothetical protein
MKGLLLTPAYRKNIFYNDSFNLLFEMIKEEFGFDMLYVDDIEIPSDIDVIIARAIPQKSYVNSLMNLANLNKNVKLIGYLHNLHGNESMKSNMIKMLNRYDFLIFLRRMKDILNLNLIKTLYLNVCFRVL